MQFDDYNQESSDFDRRATVILMTLALFPFGLVIYCFFAPEPDRPQMNHTISVDDAQLERVHNLCANLPKPKKFIFISRSEHAGLEQAEDTSTVIYSYRSIRGAEEIMPVFLLWFDEHDWRRNQPTSAFEKARQSVYISVTAKGASTQYEIYCSERD
jgi:hypothetical protein